WTEWFMVIANVTAAQALTLASALISGSQAGCDWLGTPDLSPSIRWQVAEGADTYADGLDTSLGLPVASPKLPVGGIALVPPSARRPGATRLRVSPRRTRLRISGRRTRLRIEARRTRLRVAARRTRLTLTTRDGG
ncbi:MAG TPA: hypothetical protein VFR97_10290, partial [Capillimicrobium sp.]|nr:hypothetical protein [Capillimicrobium sp.]